MDVIECIKGRHSTRAYKDDIVDQDTIVKIMEAANYSPSWANTQPWEVFVAGGEVLDKIRSQVIVKFRTEEPPSPNRSFPKNWPEEHKHRTQMMAAAHLKLLGVDRDDKEARSKMNERNLNFFGAPAVIFPCIDSSLSQWSMFDVGIFSQSVMLAAQSYGLNTIPAVMMVSYPEIIKQELEIPENLDIVIGIALGYGKPDDIQNKHITERRPVKEFLRLIGI